MQPFYVMKKAYRLLLAVENMEAPWVRHGV